MENNQKSTLEQEIVIVDITEGDYNDVYTRGPIVKGTWEQIEAFVKDYFTEEGLKRAEDISGDGFCLAVYEQIVDENGNDIDRNDKDLDDDQVPQIEYYVDASRIEENEIDPSDVVIDLTKEDAS